MKHSIARRSLACLIALVLLFAALTACSGTPDPGPPVPVAIEEAVDTVPFGIAFRQGNTALRDQVWAALQVLSADGTVGQIAQNWFGYDPTTIPADPTATADLEDVRERRLIVGIDAAAAPMSYLDESGAFRGFDVDLARAAGDYFGWEVDFFPIAWTDREMELVSGNVDCIWGGLTLTDHILERMEHTESYMENRQVLLTMSHSGITNLRGMRGGTLALRQGSAAELALERNTGFRDQLEDIFPQECLALGLDALRRGLVDAVLMYETAARYYIRTGDAAIFAWEQSQ
ncbi:MAG: transporter substrate-binding domain-containing protein [Oscillospiraceae bacterium]|nr:transporter substrate-binding domain-containing protein [Oscillospiraceae bacterium]